MVYTRINYAPVDVLCHHNSITQGGDATHPELQIRVWFMRLLIRKYTCMLDALHVFFLHSHFAVHVKHYVCDPYTVNMG